MVLLFLLLIIVIIFFIYFQYTSIHQLVTPVLIDESKENTSKKFDIDSGSYHLDNDQQMFNFLMADRCKIKYELDSTTKVFKSVNNDFLNEQEYKCFMSLFDNYESDRKIEETETGVEKEEISNFMNLVSNDDKMLSLYNYLNGDNKYGSYEDFINYVKNTWFKIDDKLNNCTFEHVFIGEIKGKQVTGYHNWVKYYTDETKGEIKLKKVMNIVDLYDYKKVTLSMDWNGKNKKISGFVVGISPITEFIVKTFIILLNKETTIFDNNIVIKMFRHGTKISTIYFE